MERKELFPLFTLSGSSMKHLTEDLTALRQHLEGVLNKIAQVTPHPRDYIHDTEKYQAARAIHDIHVDHVKAMLDFYREKEEHCHDQTPK